jgi:hypothetical protein
MIKLKEKSMRKEMLEATRQHAIAHITKHKMNVEVYLNNPVGVGEHSDIMDAIEKEIEEMAKYNDHLEILDKYFS